MSIVAHPHPPFGHPLPHRVVERAVVSCLEFNPSECQTAFSRVLAGEGGRQAGWGLFDLNAYNYSNSITRHPGTLSPTEWRHQVH